ncbi:TorF family putative porin [Massilia sp. TSP1-1-2]|uniref:TorF family putative porin n=1 Tax=unclassified Massilia TaxID=2609279 RepID=UPI003CF371CF
MKTKIYVAALLTLFAGNAAKADEALVATIVDEAKPDKAVSMNAALVSDYRFRGISQSRLKSAAQGGADYVHNRTGLYAGAWLSTITWAKDAGGGGNTELDLYAGKRGQFGQDVRYDVGVLTYVYPSNNLAHVAGFANANTTELYGQLGYGPAYIKYSHALTNLFGFMDSKNSAYLDVGANIDAGNQLVINLHAGHQNVKSTSAASYTDWKAGATRDFGVVSVAAALIGTNAGKVIYASPANGKFLGRSALTVTVSKTF